MDRPVIVVASTDATPDVPADTNHGSSLPIEQEIGAVPRRRFRNGAFGAVLRLRDFRLLWIGEGVSLLGTHYQVVALSWLILQLTGSGLALGSVLMVAAISRALFVLLGGALTDYLSPRYMMLIANVVRGACAAVLTALVALDAVHMWHLYVLASIFGLMGALFQPAYLSMVPRLSPKELMPSANALLFATSQLTSAVAPLIAGYVMRWTGAAIAFGLDAASFFFAAMTIAGMRAGSMGGRDTEGDTRKVLRDIRAAVNWIWSDRTMRPVLFVVAGVNLFLAGPLSVGLPVLAHVWFSHDPAALGVLLSSLGSGAFLGILLAGTISQPRRRGWLTLGGLIYVGLLLATLGIIKNILLSATAAAMLGLTMGFIAVMFISWIQLSTQREMIGRMMSIIIFASVVLAPISHIIAGFIADLTPDLLFSLAGALMVVLALFGLLIRPLRTID